ncbi:MAG TPA: hypothetical protein VM144_04865 [Aestuariivirga sp.]|nr:hypothetical protein [Aestuariivirga sp.]
MPVSQANYLINTHKDAIWYLAIAKELQPTLPIDEEVERLDAKGILIDNDSGKRAARKSVYSALIAAFNGPESARVKQEGRKATPTYFGGMSKRLNKILQNYDEIYATLHGSDVGVAMHHLEDEFASTMPPEKRQIAIRSFQDAIQDFVNIEETLYNFQRFLQFGSQAIRAKPGRPKLATFYFVQSLGMDWYKMTGTPPTRIYDAINSVEAGDFFHFCVASASTVRGVVEFGSFDSAIRKVCREWHINSSDPFSSMDDMS